MANTRNGDSLQNFPQVPAATSNRVLLSDLTNQIRKTKWSTLDQAPNASGNVIGMYKIGEVVTTDGSNNLDILNIPQTYTRLKIVFSNINTNEGNANARWFTMAANADFTNNRYWSRAMTYKVTTANATQGELWSSDNTDRWRIPYAYDPTSSPGWPARLNGEFILHNYAEAIPKMMHGQSMQWNIGGSYPTPWHGLYIQSVAITSIRFGMEGANFRAGGRISVYGLV